MWAAGVYGLAVAAVATPPPADASAWTAGATARLRVVQTKPAAHDGSYGSARVELQALGDHRQILSKEIEGTWRVLAYAPAARAFVIGGQFETGAWLPLDAVSYLDEATGALRPARFTGTWIAFAAVAGPNGRFVAFVGKWGPDADTAGRFRLQVLDAAADALYDVGPAPAPPPDSFWAEEHRRRCDWGDPVDGFVEMDAGIVRFTDDHTLRASYGADSCLKRGARRREQTWDLEKIVARGRKLLPPPAPELKNSLN
ncbi:MAG TPA: hypothetical protein VN903_15670 [Polyangia bacterium]|nr:hypothetical protein [Polyangia bacterium]